MPELPEVEIVRRGIEPHLVGRRLVGARLRVPKLRWPLPERLDEIVSGQEILAVQRRAKYLLLRCSGGCLLLHLGMTGVLRVVDAALAAGRHDHVDLLLSDGHCLRFTDSRRFGALLWIEDDPHRHRLLVELGPEPFAAEMDGDYLYRRSRGRKVAIKSFIMDQKVVVGVGNIYASEALHRSGIHPLTAAGRIGLRRLERLAAAIASVLGAAIGAGGTTLGDFADAEGRPGYFARALQVYGRAGEPCTACRTPVRRMRQAGRSTYYCPRCQAR